MNDDWDGPEVLYGPDALGDKIKECGTVPPLMESERERIGELQAEALQREEQGRQEVQPEEAEAAQEPSRLWQAVSDWLESTWPGLFGEEEL